MEGEASCRNGVELMGSCGVRNSSHVVRGFVFYMPIKKLLYLKHCTLNTGERNCSYT